MNWRHRVHQRGHSDEDYHHDACIATRCHEMSKKKKKKKQLQQQQLATRYQCLKAFLHQKVDRKNRISRTYMLIPEKANT